MRLRAQPAGYLGIPCHGAGASPVLNGHAVSAAAHTCAPRGGVLGLPVLSRGIAHEIRRVRSNQTAACGRGYSTTSL